LKALLTGVVISPWASRKSSDEVNLWMRVKGHSYPVRASVLNTSLTPSPEELNAFYGPK